MRDILINALIWLACIPVMYLIYKRTIKDPKKQTRQHLLKISILTCLIGFAVIEASRLLGF